MHDDDTPLSREIERLGRENFELARDKRLAFKEISSLNAQLNCIRRSLNEPAEFRREALAAIGLAAHSAEAAQVHDNGAPNLEIEILSKIVARSARHLYFRVVLELEANICHDRSGRLDFHSLQPIQEIPINADAYKVFLFESGILDAEWYNYSNPDVRNARSDPYEHFAYYGDGEMRAPRAGVSPSEYLKRNPDVAESPHGPTFHYLMYGINEGRSGYFL